MRVRRALVSVLGLALLTTLGACGGGDKPEFAAAVTPAPLYDVYFSAIDSEGTGGSALYGLTLDPVRAYRLNVEDRAFRPSAYGDQVIVVGAGEKEGIGLLQPDGTVREVPGLGRPDIEDPHLLPDGRIRWSDEKNGLQRFLEWDPTTRRKKVLDQVRSKRYVEFASGPGSGWVRAEEVKKDTYRLSVVTAKKTYTHKLPSAPRHLSAGRDWIVALVNNDEPSAKSDYLLLVIDPRKGQRNDVEGLKPLAWSPGGRRLLAVSERFAGKPQELVEIWFNKHAVMNRPLGEIPASQVGYGTWRTGIPAPLCKECDDKPTLEKDY